MSNSSHSPHDTNQPSPTDDSLEGHISDPLQYSKNPATTFLEVKELWLYASGDQITLTRPDTPIAVPLEETSIETKNTLPQEPLERSIDTSVNQANKSHQNSTPTSSPDTTGTGTARYRHGISSHQSYADESSQTPVRTKRQSLDAQPTRTRLQPDDVPQTFAGEVTSIVTYKSQVSNSYVRELSISFATETASKLPTDITGATLYSLVPASTQAIDPEDVGDTAVPVPLLEFHSSWDATANTIHTIPTLSITESNCYQFGDPQFRHPLVRMGLGQVEYMDTVATATLEPTGTVNLYASRALDEVTHEVGYISAKHPVQRMTLPELRTLIDHDNVVPKSEYAIAMLSKM